MSAVVAIMNREAMAIAADSAVTVNGKVFNHALKIFTLSKFHPVGVMIYNSASFMHTRWETIIKIYRKQLSDKSFATVKEYSEDFIQFLKEKNCFTNEAGQKDHLRNGFLFPVFLKIFKDAENKIGRIPTIEEIDLECDIAIKSLEENIKICPDFIDYSFERFVEYLGAEFENLFDTTFIKNGYLLTGLTKGKLRKIVYMILIREERVSYYTGLVFVGFGESQIFPSLVSTNFHFAIQDKLKVYDTYNNVDITYQIPSAIRPFAQTETMNTILSGIAPNLENTYSENLKQYIEKYNATLFDIINPENPKLAKVIQNIDVNNQVKDFQSQIQDTKNQNYVNPLMEAVSNLSKEDLAEMAESLIYLTYLQKRITFATEDVGGAVDVALISKGDGFIWIKRKHYFKPELNTSFFDNYLK